LNQKNLKLFHYEKHKAQFRHFIFIQSMKRHKEEKTE